MTARDPRAACSRSLIVEPGASRFCHLDAGHAGNHETRFRGEVVRWPAVTLGRAA